MPNARGYDGESEWLLTSLARRNLRSPRLPLHQGSDVRAEELALSSASTRWPRAIAFYAQPFSWAPEVLGRLARAIIVKDQSVDNPDDTAGMGGNGRIVRHQNDRYPVLTVELAEEVENLLAGLRVEVAGRLIGDQERATVDERASDRHVAAVHHLRGVPARDQRDRPSLLAPVMT